MRDFTNCNYDHERDAFMYLKEQLDIFSQDLALYPNFFLIDHSQSLYLECDLIALSKNFFAVIELKNWYGEITIDDYKWSRKIGKNTEPFRDLHIANKKKAQVLSANIKKEFPGLSISKIPWTQSIIAFTHDQCEVFGNKSAKQYLSMKNAPKQLTLSSLDQLQEYISGKLQQKGNNNLTSQEIKQIWKVYDVNHKAQIETDRKDFYDFGGWKIIDDVSKTPLFTELLAESTGLFPQKKRLRILGSRDDIQMPEKLRSLEVLKKIGKHKNIRNVDEFPNDKGLVVESTDWDDCKTLDVLMNNVGVLSGRRGLTIALGILEGLRSVHHSEGLGVIHRNINPESILINSDDTPEIIDFNFAYDPNAKVTVFSDDDSYSHLTAPYTAPEIYSGSPDYKSDLYSVGTLIFKMLTGVDAIMTVNDFSEDGRIPEEIASKVDEDNIRSFLKKVIVKNPNERLSHEEMIKEISLILGQKESTTQKDSLGDFTPTWANEVQIAEGATSRVFKIDNQGEICINKVFKEHVTREMALKERDFLRLFNNPNIIRYKSFFQYKGKSCLQLEYAQGVSLKKLIDEKKLPSFESFNYVTVELLQTLEYMHACNEGEGVIHNDISPKNIIFNEEDSSIKLIDFGSASKQGFVTICGTPGYIASDLIDKGLYDSSPDGDLYSLAVTLNEWLGGNDDKNKETVFEFDELETHQNLNLNSWLDKALKSKREERFAKAKEMLVEFQNALNMPLPKKTNKDQTQIEQKELDNLPATDITECSACDFVSYLNQMHNANSDNANALAESQATNKFFGEIYSAPPIVESLFKKLTTGQHKIIIVTGHAGDGKSTIALDIFKRLKGLPLGKELKQPLEKFEEVIWNQRNYKIVKDMSELSCDERAKILRNAVQESQSTWLIITNTGPLLSSFCDLYPNDQVENSILTVLSQPVHSELLDDVHKLCIEESERHIWVINLTRLDNIATAKNIFHNIIDNNNWDDCSQCEARSCCPIAANVIAIKQSKDAIRKIGWVYRRLTAYDQRMTLRQMTAHFTYSLTGGLACGDVQKIFRDNPSGISSDFLFSYLFSNTFFGFRGNRHSVKSQPLVCINKISPMSFGSKNSPLFQRIFSLDTGVSFPEVFQNLYKDILLNSSNNSIAVRYSLRRFVYFFGSLSEPGCKPEELNRQFAEMFLESANLIKYESWIEEGFKENSIYKKSLLAKTLNALQEQFTGLQTLTPQGLNDSKLYLTLKRSDYSLLQPVQILLAKFDYKDDFELKFNDEERILELLFKKKSEIKLKLPLPVLDFITLRSRGEYSDKIDPIYVNQLECFKSDLLSIPKQGDDEVSFICISQEGTIKSYSVCYDESKEQLVEN